MLNQNRLDVDSKKINEFMMEEFKNDFAKDEFHARSALNIIEEIEFDNDDCKEIRDIAVKKIGDSEFSNLNAVLFVANSMDCREIQEYILKFQKEIDGKSFFQSLAKYLKKMDKEKIEVLVNTFPEECDAALLYGLKKIRNREEDGETMKIIGKFPAEKIGKSPIFTENSTVFCENMQKVEGLADLANQLSGYSKPKTHKENN